MKGCFSPIEKACRLGENNFSGVIASQQAEGRFSIQATALGVEYRQERSPGCAIGLVRCHQLVHPGKGEEYPSAARFRVGDKEALSKQLRWTVIDDEIRDERRPVIMCPLPRILRRFVHGSPPVSPMQRR
jgi:hypothetical protein